MSQTQTVDLYSNFPPQFVKSFLNMRIGDKAKVTVICLCVLFLSCIILTEMDQINIFSPSYTEQGFCISNLNQDNRAIQSHAISFYADFATAMGMLTLVYFGRHRFGFSEPSMKPIGKNAVSLLGHGCGHLYLAIQTDNVFGASHVFEGLTTSGQCIAFAAFTGVWYCFMRDSRRSFKTAMMFALAHNIAQIFFIPSRFFFTHVLMAVLLNSAFRNLARPEQDKDVYYDMEAALVDVPILLASFGEALTCDSFLVHYGGHVWFDMVVPVMFGVYYLILVCNPHLAKNDPSKKNVATVKTE